jgi:hypothetical protein
MNKLRGIQIQKMKKIKNTLKISRGYRLRKSTHSLIKNLELLTSQDSDMVISKSCTLYYKKIFEDTETLKLKPRKAS